MRLPALLFVLALFPSISATAAWHEASSEHFVIYADDSERNVRRFAEKLERYRSAMAQLFPSRNVVPSPSNRPRIYAVGSEAKLRSLYSGSNAGFVMGFYIPAAGNSSAFIPTIRSRDTGELTQAEAILMHEYAHHFMLENLSLVVPPWFMEGFAEYFSAASFEGNGNIILGMAPQHREYDFTEARETSIEELLDTATYEAKRRQNRYDDFYLRSWTLFHYLYSTPEGKNKLVDYLNRLNRGESELDSARAAFGDLRELDRQLDTYIRGRIPSWRVFGDQLAVAPITIRQLDKAESATMPLRMLVMRDDESRRPEALAEARSMTEKYSESAAVWAIQARAEYAAEQFDAAITAADRALSLEPENMDALILKGLSLTRRATLASSADAWTEVRSHFIGVNKLEPDHPIPLWHFYISYGASGTAPTANSVEGLEWAQQLAPYDSALRMTTAEQQLREGRFEQAIQTASVLAFTSHETGLREAAIALLEKAQAGLAAR